MLCPSWILCLIGVAPIAIVALALPSQDPSFDGVNLGQTEEQEQQWCSYTDGTHLDDSDDLGALREADLNLAADNKNVINVPANVFIVGTPEAVTKLTKTSPILRLQEALEEGYSGLGISFSPLKSYIITGKVHGEHVYSTRATETSLGLQRQVRAGGAETLNIYIVANMTPGLLGFAYFPQLLQRNVADLLTIDGVFLSHAAMVSYLSKKAIVHEVGHWLGLFHPFAGGCAIPDGDHVPDTPQAEVKGDLSCTDGKDSCPGLPGLDLIRNYMTYSTCTGKLSFTSGQVSKMRQAWGHFRNPSTRQLPPLTNWTLRGLPTGAEAGAMNTTLVDFKEYIGPESVGASANSTG
ncbi:Extracellular metalloprotease [Colletotrichum tanaceti]|uniref:Extracellular metalloprotease n=1 Tax=Colletotrichum tanaceti TaxID=1306861 RepID=A0A4U6XFQ7_9PEZI|nr:Extracellular metalloprotease [Colletotrichum tanaceti]TKW54384.1 Extracellular metalloprotease [Colletotrichum tanaceti]